MNLKLLILFGILMMIRSSFAEESETNSNDNLKSTKENDLNDSNDDTMVEEEELNDEELQNQVKIEYLNKVDNCKKKAKAPDFVSLNFVSKWLNTGETILTTEDRNVPIEIQLGSKMLSAGVDYGLTDICIGEKRKLTGKFSKLGLAGVEYDETKKDDLITVELELVGISDKMTLNTFHYLDLNGDGKISVKEAENLIKMFLSSLTSLLPSIDLNQLLSFFLAMHDSNGDGQIDMNEFLKTIKDVSMKDEL